MKNICFIRSNGIVGDSRVSKYLDFYHSTNIPYFVIGWNRTKHKTSLENAIFYNHNSGYNVGGMKAVYYRLLWFIFILKTLFRNRPKIIHACDLDCAYPAAIYKTFFPKTKLIFDVFDWYSDTLCNQPWLIRQTFKLLERFSIRRSDHVIICEEERLVQIPMDIKSKYSVLPNIPKINSTIEPDKKKVFDNNLLTLSYVGGLYDERFLDELIRLAQNKHYNLLIAGYGDRRLEQLLTNIQQDNIRFYGKVNYIDGLKIMANTDIIFAMYCKTNRNHIYAAPNKLYEAMFLGKPILTTKKTLVGEKVQKLDCGYIIDENINELSELIEYLQTNRNELKQKGKNGNMMWSSLYSNYVDNYFDKTYSILIS